LKNRKNFRSLEIRPPGGWRLCLRPPH